ncbi:putative tetratricopeptide-like helical domain superfamily [Helianthus annuus]|nr:putative tetratricopeptide-like helical domain superfamily [Helianthus annuus]KAJ0468756.1 putative tetratricopeptide-like helical domain superfamily [Helianthus annuus]KAJ0660040.1 putative tetratricopeptide-like helical domain superfamily [Helianthus annuus]KAJ0853874.1 putative tetratricopeptide-like helical domain superfamily [Helianthus annuus]
MAGTHKYIKSTQKTLSLLNQQYLSTSQINQIHAHLIISGSISDPFAAGKLLLSHIASNPTNLQHTYTIFQSIPHRSTYIWNTMIKACTEQGDSQKAFHLFKHMFGSGFLPTNYTFSFVLRACADVGELNLGLECHDLAVKLGWESYDFVQNGLVHLYAVCGCLDWCRRLFDSSLNKDVVTWTAVVNGYVRLGEVEVARQLFDEMPKKNNVSWSVMINGYVQVGLFKEALDVFNDMLCNGFQPNHSSIVVALSACGFLGALDQGRWIHAYVDKKKMELDGVLGTALVDMYAKCGCIELAYRVFEQMPYRDVFAFTSLISGMANHGESARAIALLSRMETEGVKPNEITFICVLNACSRMGLVKEGARVFESMTDVHGIKPTVKHYGCLVDLLGGAGMLEQAKKVVTEMPMEPDSYVLGALLNACRVHGNVELGLETVEGLVERGLDRSGVHVLLSNIYASVNQWGYVENVRKRMEDKQVKKDPGCSLIEVDGVVSEFVAGNKLITEEFESLLSGIDKHSRSYWIDDYITCGS